MMRYCLQVIFRAARCCEGHAQQRGSRNDFIFIFAFLLHIRYTYLQTYVKELRYKSKRSGVSWDNFLIWTISSSHLWEG